MRRPCEIFVQGNCRICQTGSFLQQEVNDLLLKLGFIGALEGHNAVQAYISTT